MKIKESSRIDTRIEHYTEIDICRGIGILLVVLGHALKQTGETNTVFNILLSVIYSFHMPLFFVLSGFVSVKMLDFTTWGQRTDYVKKRAVRLLIPYFVIGVLYMPLKYFLARFAVKAYDFSAMWKLFLGENPDVALWFLYYLFFISVVCAVGLRKNNMKIWIWVSFAAAALTFLIGKDIRILRYPFFFILGIWLRLEYGKIKNWLSSRSCLLYAAAVFAGSNAVLYLLQISGVQILTTLSGIVVCLALSGWIAQKENVIHNLFLHWGKYSMDIYILSEPFNTAVKILCWSILHIDYRICTLFCFLVGMIVPIPVSKYLIRKVKILRVAILGMR